MSDGQHEYGSEDANPSELAPTPGPCTLRQMWWRLCLVLAAIVLPSTIALVTRYGAHPDEVGHAHGFRYYEEHWWPPDVNSDEATYSPQGWSRLYSRELVYILYGRLGRLVRQAVQPETQLEAGYLSMYTYRFANVALFALTIACLLFARRKTIDPLVVGLTALVIPQVYYLYSYMNSDAWGLSVSLFLFLLALKLVDRPAQRWSWTLLVALGVLTGLLIVSKKPFWLAAIIPYSLLAWRGLQSMLANGVKSVPWGLKSLVLVGLTAFAVAAPLRIIYPNSQGDYQSALAEMQAERARDHFNPSAPTARGYHLKARGERLFDMLTERNWFPLSLHSFYGKFGYWNVSSPPWVNAIAIVCLVVASCMTLLVSIRHWADLSDGLRLALLLAPIVLALNFSASIYNSWVVDFQPQGRYLFPSLVPLSLIAAGTVPIERGKLRIVRWVLFVTLLAVSIYTLILAATEPALL